jgi:uncharacterized protein (DUF427 family)
MGLTYGDGPLAAGAPKTVNYRVEAPAHRLLAHPFPRRVRAEFAGRTVLDTTGGFLLHETGLPPRLYVPETDLDASAFVPSDHTTHCPFKGDATYRTLTVGDRVVENALWAYPDPKPEAPWLAGYASLYWAAADTWYDEDEPVRGLTDPYHRVDVRRSARHVQVLAGDTVDAESHEPLVLAETGLPLRYYLTPDEVRLPLEPTSTTTFCPYKGDATYWDVRLPGDRGTLTDAVWSYEEPYPESARIAGRVSLLHDDLTLLVDGRPVQSERGSVVVDEQRLQRRQRREQGLPLGVVEPGQPPRDERRPVAAHLRQPRRALLGQHDPHAARVVRVGRADDQALLVQRGEHPAHRRRRDRLAPGQLRQAQGTVLLDRGQRRQLQRRDRLPAVDADAPVQAAHDQPEPGGELALLVGHHVLGGRQRSAGHRHIVPGRKGGATRVTPSSAGCR